MRASTLGELKASGYVYRPVKEEIRQNLIGRMKEGRQSFHGILGYEDTVIPDTERALLSRHNILFLGLRGQAKTRMARQMVDLLDEYVPTVEGSEVNDDPLHPTSGMAKRIIEERGDETPLRWMHRSERYGEKLATPDVSVADLIGDIDPVKAANLKLSFADERVIHYGIIPRCNRGIFVINELPDLQARIQVALFNILQEGDIQIRGFKLRMPLDIVFVFTANPEDYTNRGAIVTPLKDRIESQILTHYPKSFETARAITSQEAHIHPEQSERVAMNELASRLIEQVAFEARQSELVDQKSGVSARLTISACENAYSAAERRAILNGEGKTQVWVSDLAGIIPSVTGKIELVYEGEQEGPFQVSYNLLERSIRTLFSTYFPSPESLKKRRGKEAQPKENPFRPIIGWFDAGNTLDTPFDMTDEERWRQLCRVDGLHALVKKHHPQASEQETALLMEFVLHGLASHSLISKKSMDRGVSFKDLMGSMLDLGRGGQDTGDEEEDS